MSVLILIFVFSVISEAVVVEALDEVDCRQASPCWHAHGSECSPTMPRSGCSCSWGRGCGRGCRPGGSGDESDTPGSTCSRTCSTSSSTCSSACCSSSSTNRTSRCTGTTAEGHEEDEDPCRPSASQHSAQPAEASLLTFGIIKKLCLAGILKGGKILDQWL